MSRDCCSDLTSVTGYSKIAPFFKQTANQVQFPKRTFTFISSIFLSKKFQFTIALKKISGIKVNTADYLPSNHKTVKVSF